MRGNILHKKVRIMLVVLALLSMILGFSITQGFAEVYRPSNPVMDYVPQYVGIYDTYYGYSVADDCRVCHGSREAGAKRHQFTASAFTGCPDGCPLPSPDCLSACHTDPDNPQSITDDCLTCHPASSGRVGGPHHETDLAGSGQCTSCHQPDLLIKTRSVKLPAFIPTTYSYTPTPYSCENCHWPSGDTPHIPPPDWPRPIEANGRVHSGDLHPSKPYRPPDNGTHMQGISGKVYSQCYFCHASTSNYPNFDPANPLLIRYCESCHSKNSLHGIEEHVTAGHGLTANEKCIACHGGMPANPIVSAPKPPAITGISPSFGPNETSFSISGENFGSSGSILLIPRMGETGVTYRIPSGQCSWTNELIECVPSGLGARNYDVKAETPNGTSNTRVFTLTETTDCIPCPTQLPTITSIAPKIGAGNALVTIKGQNFGDRHAGIREVLLIGTDSAGSPVTCPANILSWKDNKIQFRIPAWTFSLGPVKVKVKTENGTSNQKNFKVTEEPRISLMDYSDMVNLTITGKGFRATRQGMLTDGYYGWKSKVNLNLPDQTITVSPGNITSWSNTEIKLTLPQIQTGTYGVTVKTIYFYDTDKNGKYTSGVDTVYQTIESDPHPLTKP